MFANRFVFLHFFLALPYLLGLFIGGEIYFSAHALEPYRANPEYFYKVSGETSLGEISMRLYGTTQYWKQIAEASALVPPYLIHQNLKLKLPKKPKLTSDQGTQKLYQMWSGILTKNLGGKKGQKAEKTLITKVDLELEFQRHLSQAELLKHEQEELKLKQEQERQIQLEKERIRLDKEEQERKQFERKLAEEQNTGEQEAPEPKALDAETHIAQAKKAMNDQEYLKAAQEFESARKIKKDFLEAWIGQIRALSLLEKKEEAKKLALELIGDHPELKHLPVLKNLGLLSEQ